MIIAKYKHSKLGIYMFNLCANWTKFLVKHRWFYYLLSCTWGILLTALGWILTLIFAIIKLFNSNITFEKYYWIYCVKVPPKLWGGFETGLMFLRDLNSTKEIDEHEFGHTFQNALLGPLFPILVGIPSAIRYWYQNIREAKGKSNKPYDSIWFEDAATQCGIYVKNYLDKGVN